jgi:hypothetical protein
VPQWHRRQSVRKDHSGSLIARSVRASIKNISAPSLLPAGNRIFRIMLNAYGSPPAFGYFATHSQSPGIGISESFEVMHPGRSRNADASWCRLSGSVAVEIWSCQTLAGQMNKLTRAQFGN